MKRFLSMLATLVLVWQSVVTPAVYAMQWASENEESVSETVVETTIDESDADDGSSDDEVVADVDDSTSDAEKSAELEETADAEESAEVDNSEASEESEISEIAEAEKVEEPEVKATEASSSNAVEELVSYPAAEFFGYDKLIQVNASVEEWIFPEGTTMKVSQITASEAEDIAKEELWDAVKSAIWVDISFRDIDGNEIEPKNAQDVHISVSLINRPFVRDMEDTNLTIVHQDNDGNTQSIQNVDVDKGYAQAKAEFDHNHFSIFVIALVEWDSWTALCTYNFKSWGEILNTQIVKNGEKLVNPGTPDLTSETGSKWVKQFLWWYNWDDKIEFGAVNDCTKTTTIDVNAKIVTTYYLTFIAEEEVGKTKVEWVQQFTINEWEPTKVTFDDVTVVAANIEWGANRVSIGWSTTQDGTNPVTDNTVNVAEVDTLYAIIEAWYWIYFDENDGWAWGWASYVWPKYLVNWITEWVDMPQSVRKGYEFKGWYKDAEWTEEFNWWSDSITENTTLYAKWEANKNTTYTVIIWKQNVSWWKDASGNVLYDFGESYTWWAVTDTVVTESLYRLWTQKNYGGFTYSWMKLDEKTIKNDNKVRAKWDTIINLYYDRDVITLNFYLYSSTQWYQISDWENSGRYYIPDWNWWYVEVQLYRHDSKWYKERKCNKRRWCGWFWADDYDYSDEYIGDVYMYVASSSRNLYQSMTWLYGQTLENRNFTWPKLYDWYDGHDSDNNWNITANNHQHLTFLDSFLENQNLYGKTAWNGSYTISHYKQKIDGTYDRNNPTNSTNSNWWTWNFSEKYDGFTVKEYYIWNNYPNNGTWNTIKAWDNTKFGNNLYIHYTRNNYVLTLMDEEKIHETKTGIPYEKSLSEYENQISDPDEKEWKEFKWWYEDKNGQKKFDRSSTMPANNKVLYAYYEILKYPVSLNPDGGTLIETQIPKFDVDYGEVVSKDSLMATSKSWFELVGWFDDSTNRLYSFWWVTTGVNLTAKWRKPGEVKVNYDVNWWSLNDSWKDNYGYATNSAVKVTWPATKDGYTFIAWELLDKNWASKWLYYPNGNFTISDELVKYNEWSTTEGTVTLKAKYEKTWEIWISTEKTTITYKANGWNEPDKDVTVNVNSWVEALGEDTFTRNDYILKWWSKTSWDNNSIDIEFGVLIAWDKQDPMPNELYAVWERVYTVTYTDWVEDEVFADQVTENILSWSATPAFTGSTERSGYVFKGWNPEVAWTVTGNATYTATWWEDKNGNGEDDSTELVAITFKAGDHGKLEKWTTGYTTEKTLLPWYDKYPAAPSTTADNGWEFNGWSPSYKAGEKIPLSGAELEYTAQRKQKSNPWWGGGWGWWGSNPKYSCDKSSLPANAKENSENTSRSNETTYSYGTDDSKCTFQCKEGYTYNSQKNTCEKSGWNNWWGSDDEEIELGWQVSDKCSVEWTNRSEEEIAAYLYACENDITTIRDIEKARLGDFLTRAEMAKMISVFATKELWMKPNTSKDCSNFANSIASYNQEMKDYMVMSCQLELMWIHTVNYEPIPDFMPSKRVSRAEFGTVLSRVLWWNKYEWTNSNYYVNHLNALKENNIITNINPHITEYRAWVFLMLYRSVEAIKVLKAASNESIEQQVNEELQEEWKAETGLVVEYDSGSVVPDMATVTESGTLSTWTVAEIITGSVVETETWATTTLTGEDISKEVSAETGTVVETWSTSD